MPHSLTGRKVTIISAKRSNDSNVSPEANSHEDFFCFCLIRRESARKSVTQLSEKLKFRNSIGKAREKPCNEGARIGVLWGNAGELHEFALEP
jgi:hypothetical protein